jgi:hypothetical protein
MKLDPSQHINYKYADIKYDKNPFSVGGNESSGSIKCGEFLDQLRNHLASQKGLCSMD